jgi:hypothetical protein
LGSPAPEILHAKSPHYLNVISREVQTRPFLPRFETDPAQDDDS